MRREPLSLLREAAESLLPELPELREPELLVLRALLLVPRALLLVPLALLLVPLALPLAPAELVLPELPEPLRRHTRQSARLTLPARPV